MPRQASPAASRRSCRTLDVVNLFVCSCLIAVVAFASNAHSSEVVDAKRTASSCEPSYPARSRRLQETGVVRVKMLITVEGLPTQIQVVKSSGHERLDQAALEGAACFRFEPGRVNGIPTALWYEVPVRFILE